MSIGYELKLTPLHTLSFYNAIANGGTMMKPIIVKRISKAGETWKEYPPEVIRNSVCSPGTLEKVQQLLELVVQEGTASNIKDSDYRIAGKTGTAQVRKDGKPTTLAWFVGYAPVQNPRIAIAILIEGVPEQETTYGGGSTAAPVAKAVFEQYLEM